MAAEKDKWISIMIVPEDGAGMKKWRITTRRFSQLKFGFYGTGVILLVGILSMVALGVLYGKMSQYRKMNTQLLEATVKLQDIAARLDRYEEKERRLRSILGSDLSLPAAVTMAETPTGGNQAAILGSARANELEQAIAEAESKTRRIPTTWPVDAWQITKGFEYVGNPRQDHTGIDILAPSRSSVVAAADGRVTFAERDTEFGLMVVIDHENGWESRYGHNASLLVTVGDTVRKGQQIAVFGGSDGQSTGTHLHFGISYRGRPVDPLDWLEKNPKLNLTGITE